MKLRLILSSCCLLTFPVALYGAPVTTSSVYITSTSTNDFQPQPAFKGKNNNGHENNPLPVVSNFNRKQLYPVGKNIYGIKGTAGDVSQSVLKNKLKHWSSGKHAKQRLIERLMQNNKREEDYYTKHIIINVSKQSKSNRSQHGQRNFQQILSGVENARLKMANENIQNVRNSALTTTQDTRISSEQEGLQSAQGSQSKSSNVDKLQIVVVMNGIRSFTSASIPSSATSPGSFTSASTPPSTTLLGITTSASTPSSTTLLGIITSASTPSSTTLLGITTSASTPSSTLSKETSTSTPSSTTLPGSTTLASAPSSTIAMGTSTSTPSSTTLPGLTTASTPSSGSSLGFTASTSTLFMSSQLMSSNLTSSTTSHTSTSSLPLSSTPSYRMSSSILFSFLRSSLFININSSAKQSSISTFIIDSESPSTNSLSSDVPLTAISSTSLARDIQPSSTSYTASFTSSRSSNLSHSRFLGLSDAFSAAATTATKTTSSSFSS